MSSGHAGSSSGGGAASTASSSTGNNVMAAAGERTERGAMSDRMGAADAEGPGWALRNLLKQSGVQEWDPRVILQLIEFQYRTTHDILLNCKDYAAHDGRTQLTEDDLQLGVQEHLRTTRKPLRSVLTQIKEKLNEVPMPPITAARGHGLRLPDSRVCLTRDNFGRDAVPVAHRNVNSAASSESTTGDSGTNSNGVMKPTTARDRYNVTRVSKQGGTERKTRLFLGTHNNTDTDSNYNNTAAMEVPTTNDVNTAMHD